MRAFGDKCACHAGGVTLHYKRWTDLCFGCRFHGVSLVKVQSCECVQAGTIPEDSSPLQCRSSGASPIVQSAAIFHLLAKEPTAQPLEVRVSAIAIVAFPASPSFDAIRFSVTEPDWLVSECCHILSGMG